MRLVPVARNRRRAVTVMMALNSKMPLLAVMEEHCKEERSVAKNDGHNTNSGYPLLLLYCTYIATVYCTDVKKIFSNDVILILDPRRTKVHPTVVDSAYGL